VSGGRPAGGREAAEPSLSQQPDFPTPLEYLAGRTKCPKGQDSCSAGFQFDGRRNKCMTPYSPPVSQENVDLVRRALEAINRRDLDGFLELAEPDVVQDWSRAMGPQSGIYRGRTEVRQFLHSWWDAFEESVIVVDELIDAGDQVVAVFHGRQRGRASGIEVEGRGAVLVWNVQNGKISSATLYQKRAEALEAVGAI
jgi:ketosteroid isomerase-like protein